MSTTVFWSDSVNVLWWVRGRSRQFKPFVANRIGEIQSNSDPDQWRYVPTSINPADLLSRGMRAADLKTCDKWWKGPEFLLQPVETCSLNKLINRPTENAELKSTTKLVDTREIQMAGTNHDSQSDEEIRRVFMTTVEMDTPFTIDLHLYSSWLKLRRITAWVNRFITNCQKQKERTSGELQTDELKVAEVQLIKEAQRVEFKEERTALSRGKPLPSSSKLLGLKPMLDEDGLMRSDGTWRARNSCPSTSVTRSSCLGKAG